MRTFDEFLNEQLQDEEFRKVYDAMQAKENRKWAYIHILNKLCPLASKNRDKKS